MITKNFQLTKKELYESLVEISKSKSSVKVLRFTGTLLLFILTFITIINIATNNFTISFGFLFPIVSSLSLIFVAEITASLQVPNLVKTNDRFTENMRFEIDSEKLNITGESFSIQMSLDKLHSVIETNNYFLLKVSEGSANVIPKRILSTEETIEVRGIVSSVSGLKVKLKKSS